MAYRDDIPFTIDQVAGLLSLGTKRMTPAEWQVNCPFCLGKNGQPDTSGHMTLDLRYDRYKCYRCGRNGGKIALYAEMRGIDTKAAYKEIMDILTGGRQRPLVRKSPAPLPSVECEYRASLEETDHTYRKLLEMLALTTAHTENLRGRGLPDGEIARLGYKSVPAVGHRRIATQLLSHGCKLEGVPGFFVDENGQWKLNVWLTGIMMPVRDINGLIQGIQIRKDDPDEKTWPSWRKKPKKCYWLTGKEKPHGTRVNTRAHFANVKADTDTVYLTEGVMKSDIAAYFGDKFFIAIPGVSHYEALRHALKVIKALEHIKRVAVAWDMDQHDNPAVMESLGSICQIIAEEGFDARVLSWNREQKGIDDFLKWIRDRRNGEEMG